ncbi:Neuropeptide F [Cryptotermes secundus]|uniref:Neuropeptide F n=1 Tax=Cryptotermes secundus TaxID=105785 RepID=A0A2J7RAG0_9NEOP|nr:neuropeptide F [Cryptotermes secundus]PNF37815.1 Neuropeptide F [Cryptotermes secundus]
MQSSLYCLLLLGCALVLIPSLTPSVSAKPTDPDQLAAMADTLKYLQELDRYYSQVARPSPRSDSGRHRELSKVENALKMLQLQELDRFYSPRTRPRFGKRAELRPVAEQDTSPDDSNDRMWRRFSSRR